MINLVKFEANIFDEANEANEELVASVICIVIFFKHLWESCQ
jgi:hypothetical protein